MCDSKRMQERVQAKKVVCCVAASWASIGKKSYVQLHENGVHKENNVCHTFKQVQKRTQEHEYYASKLRNAYTHITENCKWHGYWVN